jgi:hypothetical protein
LKSEVESDSFNSLLSISHSIENNLNLSRSSRDLHGLTVREGRVEALRWVEANLSTGQDQLEIIVGKVCLRDGPKFLDTEYMLGCNREGTLGQTVRSSARLSSRL